MRMDAHGGIQINAWLCDQYTWYHRNTYECGLPLICDDPFAWDEIRIRSWVSAVSPANFLFAFYVSPLTKFRFTLRGLKLRQYIYCPPGSSGFSLVLAVYFINGITLNIARAIHAVPPYAYRTWP